MDHQRILADLERIGTWRLIWWFLAINVPIALALSYLFGTLKKPDDLLLRGVIAFASFQAGMFLFLASLVRAMRPMRRLGD
jgi:hypothetical protein